MVGQSYDKTVGKNKNGLLTRHKKCQSLTDKELLTRGAKELDSTEKNGSSFKIVEIIAKGPGVW